MDSYSFSRMAYIGQGLQSPSAAAAASTTCSGGCPDSAGPATSNAAHAIGSATASRSRVSAGSVCGSNGAAAYRWVWVWVGQWFFGSYGPRWGQYYQIFKSLHPYETGIFVLFELALFLIAVAPAEHLIEAICQSATPGCCEHMPNSHNLDLFDCIR